MEVEKEIRYRFSEWLQAEFGSQFQSRFDLTGDIESIEGAFREGVLVGRQIEKQKAIKRRMSKKRTPAR